MSEPDQSLELDLGNLFFRILDYVYFVLLSMGLYIGFAWFIGTVEEASIQMDDKWLKSAAIVLASFVTGVIIGLKISRQKGGMLTLVFGMLAMVTFTYLMTHEIRQLDMYARYIPLLRTTPHPFIPYVIPGAGFLGMLMYRFFTVSAD